MISRILLLLLTRTRRTGYGFVAHLSLRVRSLSLSLSLPLSPANRGLPLALVLPGLAVPCHRPVTGDGEPPRRHCSTLRDGSATIRASKNSRISAVLYES